MEVAFFAAAPADEAVAVAAPETFDDLDPPPPPPRLGWAQGLLAAARAALGRGATDP